MLDKTDQAMVILPHYLIFEKGGRQMARTILFAPQNNYVFQYPKSGGFCLPESKRR